MGKLKSGKKLKAGSNFNSAQSRKPHNPFEEKIIKEKQQIFGQSQKNAKGKPGESRTQACLKRKHTLLHEYEQQHKTNSISDYRIGEKNRFISQEDKTVARYAAIRAKHKSKQLYNLESNEVLTHHGQTLNEIEKFEDPRSDDDDSDEGNISYGGGKLDKQFVGQAHFGGGVLSRKVNTGNKSYKDIISQLITDSKRRKVEKQRDKECTQELTDKLDSEWKDLLPLMTKQSKAVVEEEQSPLHISTVDMYDKYVKELRFEARGVPSDKLKTSTEIAAEAAKTREILERELFARMQGPCFSNPIPVHRSADDLFDNCTAYNTGTDEENAILGYNDDGVLINSSAILEDLDANNKHNIEERISVDEEEQEESSKEEQEESSEDEQDNYSDLQSDDSDSESDRKNLFNKQRIERPQFNVKPITGDSFPKTYEDFKQIFQSSTYSEYDLKLNHLIQYAKTTPNRKDDIRFLLTSLLRYIRDADLTDPMNVCDHLIPGAYQLVQVDPETACSTFVETLRENWTEYKSRKSVSVGALMWFKVVASVFSVSDFRHAVATPGLLILEEMLGRAAVRIRSARDVASGLFLAALMMEFTSISKRFSPGLLQFLTSIVRCATKFHKLNDKWHKIWKVTKDILLLTNDNSTIASFPLQIDVSYITGVNENKVISDDFKITSMYVALKLLQADYRQLQSSDMPSRCEAFATVTCVVNDICNDGNRCLYPNDVRVELDTFLRMVKQDAAGRQLQHLTMEQKRPKPLRLYEPNIQTIYDRKVRGPKGDSKNERDKLLYKLKQERRGALREIRKDVTFLGRHRIRHQIKSDEERKANVKKIFADAAIQQSDLNTLKRKKNS